jgi:ribosomal protein L40E
MRGSPQFVVFVLGIAFAVSWLKEYAFIFSWIFTAALWVIPVLAVLAAIFFVYEKAHFVGVIYYKPVWYGAMRCRKCLYQWQSRRNTPPAKCPKCGTREIRPIEVKEKTIHRLEKKGLTPDDWKEIQKMGTQNDVPNWFVLPSLLFIAELIYLGAGNTV